MRSFEEKTSIVFTLNQEGKSPRSFQFSAKSTLVVGVALLSLLLAFCFSVALLFHEVHRNYSLLENIKQLEANVLKPASFDRSVAAVPQVQELKLETLDFHFDCESKTCLSKWLVHSKTKEKIHGKYLVVLETEFPKLGKLPPKKKYWTDPASEEIESLDEVVLAALTKKSFSFSNMLKITSVFNLNNLVKTTVLHFYLFDSDNKLVLHETHPVETKNESND